MINRNPISRFWDVKIIAPTRHSDGKVQVFIDGRNITEQLTALTYKLQAGKTPEVTLTFIPRKMTIQTLGDLQAHDVDLGPFNDYGAKIKR